MAKSYKSYMLSADKQSWVPLFDGESYNTLSDTPIKNLYGQAEEVYVDVGALKEGKYRISGYYKIDDDSELQQAEEYPIFVNVYTDSEEPTKKYAVIENVSSDSFGQTIYTIQNSAIVDTHHVGADDSAIPEIHEDIDSLSNNLSELNSSFDSSIADINSTVAGNYEELSSKIEQSVSEINETLDSEVARLDGKIDSETSSISETLESEVIRLDNKIDSETSSVSDALTSEVTRINSTLSDHSGSLSSIDSQLAVIDNRLDENDASIIDFQDEFELLKSAESVEGSIRQIAKEYTDTLDNSLATVAKTGAASDVSVTNGNFSTSNVEGVIGELYTSVNDAVTSSTVTLQTLQTPDTNDASTYILSQGGTEVGRVHIAKDLVATQGELVTEDGSGNQGMFIKMTVANGTPFYIPVDELIDTYQGSGDVGIVSSGISINVTNGVVSATIVTLDGTKLDDGSVGFGKLAQTVQDKINSIDDVYGELMGDAETDTADSKTIEGLVKKTDITSNTLSNLDNYVGTIPTESAATNVVDYIDETKDELSENIKQYLIWHTYTE